MNGVEVAAAFVAPIEILIDGSNVVLVLVDKLRNQYMPPAVTLAPMPSGWNDVVVMFCTKSEPVIVAMSGEICPGRNEDR